nr:MAG TPA: hypothetical protein [Caudoviricetes sp.]
MVRQQILTLPMWVRFPLAQFKGGKRNVFL